MAHIGTLGWAFISGSSVGVSTTIGGNQVLYMTGSDLITGSNNFTYNDSTATLNVSGTMVISGTLRADTFIHRDIQEITTTGSTVFGNSTDDTHVRTGSMTVSGSSPTLMSVITAYGHVTASGHVSASTFYGDGSSLYGISAVASPAGATTQIQFNNAGALGASADLTYNDSTNTLLVTGTHILTGAVPNAGVPGYVFSLSGSTTNSSYGSSVTGKYAFKTNDDILIDAGPIANSELSLISANGKVTIGAGGYGGSPTDIMGLRLDSSVAGASNTIASYTGAGINVHSHHILSLSGSEVRITGSNVTVTGNLGNSTFSVLGDMTGSGKISAYAHHGNDFTFGAASDLTFRDATNILTLTGTLALSGSPPTAGIPGYIFSLSGSTIDSSYGGGSVTGKYALKANDKVLIDAGPGATSELSLIAANGKVTIGAGGLGAAPQDIMGLRLDSSQAGSVNTIASYTGAGINVHSHHILSLSGSQIRLTGSNVYLSSSEGDEILSSAGPLNLVGSLDTTLKSTTGNTLVTSSLGYINLAAPTVYVTGGINQGNSSIDNYFKLSTHQDRLAVSVYSGETFYTSDATKPTSAGNVYYLSGSTVLAMTASANGIGSGSMLMMALGSTSTKGFLLRGFYDFNASSTTAAISGAYGNARFDQGMQVYASNHVNGYLTTVQPTGSGEVVRVLGHAITMKTMYFNPSPDFVTV
jgi:hypothetical protein